ncbi:MAG: alpha-ketoacid dehydrogenase subunit beta [Kiritimatiellae bacterium]|nr:alpha-ketoacid dehydrogenase subunit beta [Kiritimatiellia bacterium]
MRTLSYTEALRAALSDELNRDDSIFLLGEDIGLYGGAFGITRGLLDKFGPERVIDTPISEASFVGTAIGAALSGSRPVVEIMFMDFITLAVDQLVNQAAKLRYIFGRQAKCPLVLRTPAGGGRSYGPTHSQDLTAWFVHTPGLKVVAPSTPADAFGLLKAAIRDNNPIIFIEHKMLYGLRGPVPSASAKLPEIGKARIAVSGTDITVVAWSWMALEAEIAARELDHVGVSVEVIDLRTLSPMDTGTIVKSVKKTGRLLVVDEGCRTCGISAEIGFRICEHAFEYLVAPIHRLTSPDSPIPASPLMEQAMIPNRSTIADEILDVLDE